MSETQEDLLKSIRRHARINTALQTGALIELEAQRRQLAAQTSLLQAAQRREESREHSQEMLQMWRGWIVDVEEAEGDLVKQFVLLYQVADLIADIPTTAPLDEISRAKRLLRRKDSLLEAIRVQEADRVGQLEDWWRRNKVEERIRAVEPVGERISAAIGVAERVPEGATITDHATIIESLENARRWMIYFDQELLRIEEADDLPVYDRILVVALHGTDGEFLWRHSSGERSRLIENLHTTIEALKAEERQVEAAKKQAESFKTKVVVVVFLGLALFIWLVWVGSANPSY